MMESQSTSINDDSYFNLSLLEDSVTNEDSRDSNKTLSVFIDNISTANTNCIDEKVEALKTLRSNHKEGLTELFFLQNGGNLMDYSSWKKRPNKLLECFLESEKLEDEEPSKENITYFNQRTLEDISLINDDVDSQINMSYSEISFCGRMEETMDESTMESQEMCSSFQENGFATNSPLDGCQTSSIQESVAELARQEAQVMKKITELRKHGLWSMRRMAKTYEPQRQKVHWDYVLEEMQWLANDFAQERKTKRSNSKKISRLIGKYFQDLQQKDLKAEKEDSLKLKKIASNMSKIVKEFWSNIEKVIQFKQQSRVDEKRKKALDLHLNFIVDQTEKYSTWLTEGLVSSSSASQIADDGNKNSPKEIAPPEAGGLDSSITNKLISSPVVESDAESYVPSENEEDVDDEETINEEENIEKVDYKEELSSLQKESEMSLEELYAMYYSNAVAEEDTKTSQENKKSKDDKKDSTDLKSVEDVIKTEEKVKKEEEEEKEVPEKRNHLAENISDIAKTALSFQPTGNTLETTQVKTAVPFLLKHQLREYQHVGLDWLATMYEQRLNGILADEMGLGKTIQTIALLGFLATEKGIWGPHLIVVPTSVMLNWEMEFKKWCPGFKILTYYGSLKERKAKRQGWSKTNAFHVCITSYKLVIQDHQAFRRKKWKYFILDEAHNIKNFKSQRWQTLLNFHSQRRLLLTGTPLQNNLMELWSLMHFLMPHVFQSHSEFKEWFSNPLTGMIEGSKEYNDSLIRRLHKVLRPFLLRRLKQDVEKQMPKKYEHIVMCRLSKHQRYLYEDFMSQTATKETLASGNFLNVVSILMQLRKVCNHPNLFDPRPVVSPFHMEALNCSFPRLIINDLSVVAGRPSNVEALMNIHPGLADLELSMGKLKSCQLRELHSKRNNFFFHYPEVLSMKVGQTQCNRMTVKQLNSTGNTFRYKEELTQNLKKRRLLESRSKLESIIKRNERRCSVEPMYGTDLRSLLTIREFKDVSSLSWSGQGDFHCSHAHEKNYDWYWKQTSFLSDLVCTFDARLEKMADIFSRFVFVIPPATASSPNFYPIPSSVVKTETTMKHVLDKNLGAVTSNLHEIKIKQTVQFPDLRLIQYDCGKLQAMDVLLRQLKQGSHRVLIFTQMTKMLDVLEQFLNYHGHRYLRLDGSTKVEQRQVLMERFNMDRKIFCFILSTRSGGIGVNLTGADTVIFYDSDWNPTMDAQAQDRCHRIGQTRDVHIYRLVSERSIEENILKKANEKRLLGSVAIEGGNFTTAFFKRHSIKELFEDATANPGTAVASEEIAKKDVLSESASQLTDEQIEQALCAAEDESDILAAKTAKAEQKEELAEFDESLPWEDSRYNESSENKINKEDVSEVEAELAMLDKNLTPIERYAVAFMEVQLAPITNEELSKAEEEVGIAREEWELNHLKAIKEEEERKAEMEEDEMLFVSADVRERKIKPKKSKLPYLEMKRKMFFARNDKEAKKKADAGDNRHWVTPVVPGQRKRLKVQKLSKTNPTEDDSEDYEMPVRHVSKKFKPDGSVKQKLEFSTPPAKKPKLSSFNLPADFLRAQINSVQKSMAAQQLNNKASDDAITSTSINNNSSTPKLLCNRQFQAPNKMIVIQRFPSLLAARPLSQPRIGQLNQPRMGQLNQLGISQLNQPRVSQLNQQPTTSIISKMSENKPVPILEKMQENAACKNNIIASQPFIFSANPINHLASRPLLLTSYSNGLSQVTNRSALPTSMPLNYIVLKSPPVLGQNFILPNSSPKSNVVLVSNAHRPVTNMKPSIFILSNSNVASLVTTSATQTVTFSSPTVQTQQRFTRLIGQLPNSAPQKVTASLVRSPASLQQAPSNTVPILEKMAMQLENQNRPSIPLTFRLSSDPRFSHPNSVAVPRNAVTWAVGHTSATSLVQTKPAVNLNVSPPRLILGQNLCFNSLINQSTPQFVIINNKPPPTGSTTPTNARFNL